MCNYTDEAVANCLVGYLRTWKEHDWKIGEKDIGEEIVHRSPNGHITWKILEK